MYTGSDGWLLRSTDGGHTFSQTNLPFYVGGNSNGRATGERLAVDPNLSSTLFIGSNDHGLYKSTNSGATVSPVASFPLSTADIDFVTIDPTSGAQRQRKPDDLCRRRFHGCGHEYLSFIRRRQDLERTWRRRANRADPDARRLCRQRLHVFHLQQRTAAQRQPHDRQRLAIHHQQRRVGQHLAANSRRQQPDLWLRRHRDRPAKSKRRRRHIVRSLQRPGHDLANHQRNQPPRQPGCSFSIQAGAEFRLRRI